MFDAVSIAKIAGRYLNRVGKYLWSLAFRFQKRTYNTVKVIAEATWLFLKQHNSYPRKKNWQNLPFFTTGTCFIQKIYAPSSSLLQGKYLPFSPSPLRLNIFRLFVILSLIQLYRYTPKIFFFSTATFKYTYRAPLRRIGQEYSANVASSTFQSLKWIQPLPVCAGFFHMHSEFSSPAMCNNATWSFPLKCKVSL